ncbi:hypothetical protein QBC39DRAFT_397716 [Podospora conica]|nr:hypothetical protein QBC39DRAFT_397716 [Schizothecium conicum]
MEHCPPSDSEDMQGKPFGAGGYKGRIIFLGHGTEVLTGFDDTEMFDNAEEDWTMTSRARPLGNDQTAMTPRRIRGMQSCGRDEEGPSVRHAWMKDISASSECFFSLPRRREFPLSADGKADTASDFPFTLVALHDEVCFADAGDGGDLGHSTQQMHKNGDGTFSIVNPETSA